MFYLWKDTIDTLMSVFADICVCLCFCSAVHSLGVCFPYVSVCVPYNLCLPCCWTWCAVVHRIFDHKDIVCCSPLIFGGLFSHCTDFLFTLDCILPDMCVCLGVCLCHIAASESEVIRCSQEVSAVERHSKHQSHWGPWPPAYGRQWPQWPLCQIQNGTSKVQK